MSPQHQRWLLTEAFTNEIPDSTPMDGCAECDPSGGCPSIQECKTEVAQRLAEIAIRVMGYGV